MSRFVYFFLAILVLSACGPRGPVPVGDLLPSPVASSESPWTIHFAYSGGIAGLNRSMDVSSTGEAVVTDQRTGKTAKLQLTSGQLTQLRQLAAKAVYDPAAKPSPCADCFVYTLEIKTGSGSPLSAQMDDTNLEASGLSPLVEFLRSVMDQALKT